MPTLVQVRNAVDARLADLWTNQIVPRQDAFFAARGRYWQGIITIDLDLLVNNPNDGSAVREVAPVITRHPTDQAESWADSGINLGATVPMALEIHAYNGPNGRGFVGIVWAKWNGNLYRRSKDSGPEPWHTSAWAQVAPLAS